MQLEPWLDVTLKVAGIVVVALVAVWAVRLAIGAAVRHLLERRSDTEGPLTASDLERRVTTLQRLAVRITGALIGVIALLMILDQFDIVGSEEELRRTFAGVSGGKSDGATADPELAALHLDRQRARFADEAEDEGGVRHIVDFVRRAHLFDLALAHHHQSVG